MKLDLPDPRVRSHIHLCVVWSCFCTEQQHWVVTTKIVQCSFWLFKKTMGPLRQRWQVSHQSHVPAGLPQVLPLLLLVLHAVLSSMSCLGPLFWWYTSSSAFLWKDMGQIDNPFRAMCYKVTIDSCSRNGVARNYYPQEFHKHSSIISSKSLLFLK